jgi:hypothetical protein
MKSKSKAARTRWLAAIVVVLMITLLGAQGSLSQDFQRQYPLGDIPLDPLTYQKHLKVYPEAVFPDALPSTYDARDYEIVTSAKSQGNCGSCWAFATTGAMESHLLKAQYESDPLTLDLSEQQQVSCNTSMSGCCGGSSSSPRFWETRGPVYESCFPYGDGGTSCPTQSNVPCADGSHCAELPYRVIGWHTVSATTTGFKNSLYVDGPSYWRFNVYSDFDAYWSGGQPGEVYQSKEGYSLRGGHAVLLIGWDDSKGAFLCKNSWGTNGGPNDDGTFWIAFSGHYYSLGFGMSNFGVTSVGCSTNEECDDDLYCNGTETCVGSVCQPGTPPNCPDDGLFCNGTESCNEDIDDCDHSGDPCGVGTICNETENRCDVVACYIDGDCSDDEACTTDECFLGGTASAYCENTWPDCGAEDGCCGPACTYQTDLDCTCGNGTCDDGEDCTTCSADCISGTGGGACSACFKGQCDGKCNPSKEGPDCADCATPYCCGDGTCEGIEDSFNCAIDCGAPPVCGDGSCDPEENQCNCADDCGMPPTTETLCSDGIDNDCDLKTDCADGDCEQEPACQCLPKTTPCDTDDQCCSNKCRGGKCR